MHQPAYTFTAADLDRWLYRRDIEKGLDYRTAVSELVVEPQRIRARVAGTRREPYRVDIRFERDIVGAWSPDLQCSCPVGLACKHVAAVLMRALEERARPDRINPAVLQWVESLREASTPAPRKAASPNREMLFYVLEHVSEHDWRVRFLKGRPDAGGEPTRSARDWDNIERALLAPPAFVDRCDIEALQALWGQRPRGANWAPIALTARDTDTVLRAMLATGRLRVRGPQGLRRLVETGRRQLQIDWRADPLGRLGPAPRILPGPALLVPGDPCWYVDIAASACGPLDGGVQGEVLTRLLTLPPLGPRDVELVSSALHELLPGVPRPDSAAPIAEIRTAPLPVLQLETLEVWGVGRWRQYLHNNTATAFDVVRPAFRYGPLTLAQDDTRSHHALPEGDVVKVVRDGAAEQRWLTMLEEAGLTAVPPRAVSNGRGGDYGAIWGLGAETEWEGFMRERLPALREAGWEVVMPGDFRHRVLEVEAWTSEAEDAGEGWFEVSLGIIVDGVRHPLPPLLADLFARDPRWLDPVRLARVDDAEAVPLRLPDGGQVRVPAERIRPLAATLIDLFDRGSTTLRVAALDAARLAPVLDRSRWRFSGPEQLGALAQRLRESGTPPALDTPEGFALSLRPYQREGLGWLQYLRANGLAGILADDMGLGKTAQTLAHLLLEKQAGRLDRPALVVLPTSLVFNWRREAERCAPALRVLALHGLNRASRFADMPRHDVVLTTYPLLWRDANVLCAQPWHIVILDEAQTVKNAASKSAATVRRLDTRHRLCLTGTPLENHLGELWAQFDFLLPGFLGEPRDFSRRWRTPIEKHGDPLRRELLAARLRPFILRRRKEDVARDLPPKSVVVRSVELEGPQRDLYETVRASVDTALQREIAARGFRRSQIAILDALLKLRQACCDPRLLPGESAHRAGSAKLDLLGQMLPELVEEGRRVLVFSQFTRMLDLIEPVLAETGLPFLRLDGDTRDRETPVARFQAGEVPVFLISLKAGGVGLNLTAADTVIHFDPWWNPAVEAQATDRAHRIGQDRPVFVYKLIVAGSIEERILALQDRKGALADAMLGRTGEGDALFSEHDLAALLAPLD